MPSYSKVATNFFSISDAQRMPGFVGLDGVSVPPGPMTYFDMGYLTPDLNGDGLRDLVISLNRGAQLSNNPGYPTAFFLNDGRGGLINVSGQVQGGVAPLKEVSGLAAGNLDSDSQAEIVIVSAGLRDVRTGDVIAYYNADASGIVNLSNALPSLSATNGRTSGTANDPHAVIGFDVVIGDLNADGSSDILVLTLGAPDNLQPAFMLINNGSGVFTVRNDAALTAFSRVHFGSNPGPKDAWFTTNLIDANGDGAMDIFVGLIDRQAVRSNFIALNDGRGNFSETRVISLPAPLYGTNNTHTRDSAVADFNGDGRQDLVLAETRDSPFLAGRGVQLLYSDGHGGFSDSSARIKFVNPRPDGTQTYTNSDRIGVLDFNGDGFPDIFERGHLSFSPSKGQPAPINFSIFLNDGQGNFTEMPRSEFASITYRQDGIAAGDAPWWTDINNDGIIDFIVADATDDGTTLRMNFSVYEGTSAYSTGPNGINPATRGASGFNEQYYLNQHPDVASQVASRQVASGLDYWLARHDVPLSQTFATGATVLGSTGNDAIEMRGGRATGGAGNDTITGVGVDRATEVYAGSRSNFTLTKTGNGYTLADRTGAEGTDTLVGISRVQFSDGKLALDLSGNAGTTAKILGAVFGKASVANPSYVGIGLGLLDGGMSYQDLMKLALDARLGTNSSNADVVRLLYTNLIGTAPPANDLNFWVGQLDTHVYTPASLGVLAADTSLNIANINLVGLESTGLAYV